MPEKNNVPTSRYVIGIDLGTTNSALTFIDTNSSDFTPTPFCVLQEVAVGEQESREVLPSFIYYPTEGESSIGVLARNQSARTPGRVISSAKSWLCHDGVDRTAAILPWQGAEDIQPLSPLAASAAILRHMKNAWNNARPDYPLENQQIILTVPASFDDMARSLTVQAVTAAGIGDITLLEEPQAAFYGWLQRNHDTWQDILREGQTVLVCDIGGGTSDFSLISLVAESDKKLGFTRVAVGEHLLLGGDNLDLTLAHWAESQLNQAEKLPPHEWGVLVGSCQSAKERFFSDEQPEEVTINLAGGGRSLIGGSRQIKLTRDQVQRLLIDGFLPLVAKDEIPTKRRSGFQEFGLPYASDSAISRHLASFLMRHISDKAGPDVVLFNGGFFEAKLFRNRVLKILSTWYSREIPALHVPRLDLAVSQGAASYGMARRGFGQRIGGGLSHSILIGVTTKEGLTQGLCVAPAGMDEGESYLIEETALTLKINQPVQFDLFTTTENNLIPVGALVSTDALKRGTPLRTFLKIGKKKNVRLM